MADLDTMKLPDSSRPSSGYLPAGYSNPRDLYNRAVMRFNEGQFALAERDLHTAIEFTKSMYHLPNRESDLATMILQRGMAAKQLGKWHLAAADFSTVIERYPESKYKKEAIVQLDELKQTIGEKTETEARNEREEFTEAMKQHGEVKPGTTWHVVACRWFNSWMHWVRLGAATEERQRDQIEENQEYPGPISNFDILESEDPKKFMFDPLPEFQYHNRYLTHGLTEDSDYKLIPDAAFNVLNERYKAIDDIIRYPIEVNETMYQVELNLKMLMVAYCKGRDPQVKHVQVSRKSTITQLHQKLERCTDCSDTKLWKVSLEVFSHDQLNSVLKAEGVVYLENGKELTGDLELEDAEVGEEDVLVLETKKHGQFFFTNDSQLVQEVCAFCHVSKVTKHCSICGKVNYCTVLCERLHYQTHKPFCTKPKKRAFFLCIPCRQSSQLEDEDKAIAVRGKGNESRMGRTGLQNLGNTCYMNASLQCLSHTEGLTNWFLNNAYEAAINSKNPLSTGGRLARAYADLVRELWYGAAPSHAPWGIRKIVTAVMSQFASLRMHDAHEFLLYFLDNLHEDLNQVKNKQYVELNTDNGAPDSEKAAQAWEMHEKYNRSKIVELMHGQYKSTLTCTECSLVSILFEPFSILSLPIPRPKLKKLSMYFIFYDPDRTPVNLHLYLSYDSTIREVKKMTAEMLAVEAERLTFATITNDELRSVLTDNTPILEIVQTTLFAFESFKRTWTPQYLIVNLISAQHERGKVSFPRLCFFSGESSSREIHVEVYRLMRRFFLKYKTPADSQTLITEYETEKDRVYTLKIVKINPTTDVCGLCGARGCIRCNLPYAAITLEGIKQVIKGPFMLDLIWKSQVERLGISLKDINKCTERQGKFEQETIKLEDCFRLFSDLELLDAENYWHCPRCKKSVEAKKKMELFRVPPVLILHLKRFKSISYMLEKVNSAVDCPLKEFDLSPFLATSLGVRPIYDLYATVCHIGATLQSGHYISYCLNKPSGSWIECNDSKVRTLTIDQVPFASAYMLFYRLRT